MNIFYSKGSTTVFIFRPFKKKKKKKAPSNKSTFGQTIATLHKRKSQVLPCKQEGHLSLNGLHFSTSYLFDCLATEREKHVNENRFIGDLDVIKYIYVSTERRREANRLRAETG